VKSAKRQQGYSTLRRSTGLARTAWKRKPPKARIKPKVKRKVVSLGKLKKKLWTVFSAFIRARDNYTCFTCGRKAEGSGMHAGHFVSKAMSGFSLYFSEEAVNAQCYHCNINLSGNWLAYEEAMIRKHGKERTEAIKKLARVVTKSFTAEEYREKISYYQEYAHELKSLSRSDSFRLNL
jgi:hypothetical protein